MDSKTERESRQEFAERQRLIAILETTSDLVSTALPNGQVTFMNQAGRKLVGWSTDADLSTKKISAVHPEWALRIVEDEGIPAAIQSGVWEGETALLSPDGHEIPVSQVIMAHRSPDGALEYLSTIMRDISERIEADKALHTIRMHYDDFINASSEQVTYWKVPDGLRIDLPAEKQVKMLRHSILVDANNAFVNHYCGGKKEEAIGKTTGEVFDMPSEPFYQFIDSGYHIDNSEVYDVNNEGQEYYGLESWYGVIKDGILTNIWAASRDITEQKLAEKKLHYVQMHYADYIYKSPGFVSLWKMPEGLQTDLAIEEQIEMLYRSTCVDSNDEVWKAWGLKGKEELIGNRYIDLILERMFDDAFKKFIESGYQLDNYETCNISISGAKSYAIETWSGIVEYGELTHLWSTSRNITDHKKAEISLRRSEERYRTFFETARDGSFVTTPDGQMIECNQGLVDLFGYPSKEEFMKVNVVDHQEPKERDRLIKKIIQIGSTEPIPITYRKMSGEIFHVLMSATAMEDEYGNVERIQGHIIDITERKRVEDLQQENEKKLAEEQRIRIENSEHSRQALLGILEDQKLIEESLKASEERYRLIFDRAPDAYYLIDLKGQFVDCNAAAEKMIGTVKSELVGKNMLKIGFLPKSQLSKAAKLLAKNVMGKSTGPDEFTLLRRGGEKRDIEILTHPVKIGDKTLVLSIARDITERKKAQKELVKLSSAVQQSPASVVITDTDGNIEYVNPKALNITGYSSEEVLGKHTRILKSGEQSKTFYQDLWKTISSGEEWRGEFHNKKKNGELYWEAASISPIMDESGKIINYLAVKEDITERRLAADELAKSERKNRALLNATSDLAMLIDKKGIIIAINDAMANSFKQSPDNMMDRNIYDLLPPDLAEERQKRGQEAEKTGKVVRFVDQRIDRWLDNSVYPIFDENGSLSQFAIFSHDITAEKKSEIEREQALWEAKRANQVKTNFLANMSHEIRTPLNGIVGFADLLKHQLSDYIDEDAEVSFDYIHRSTKRLMNTVHGILDISQIEAETFATADVEIDLKQLIQGLVAEQRFKAEEKGLQLSFNNNLRKTTIQVDEYCVTNALTNLINNAIKYTDTGSVNVELGRKGNNLVFTVTDTGIGMTEEYLGRIYEPYSQESEGYSKKYQGIGLGLALTKRYIDLIGADIQVESKKGQGTTFEVTFAA